MRGKLPIDKSFTVHDSEVNVRVKGIKRSKIPGSFSVELLGDDLVIAAKAVYQTTDQFHQKASPGELEHEYVDFTLPLEKIGNYSRLTVKVRLAGPAGKDRVLSPVEAGYPTVNIRFLLKE